MVPKGQSISRRRSLAQLLPERTTPEMLFLETKWSALMSYGGVLSFFVQ